MLILSLGFNALLYTNNKEQGETIDVLSGQIESQAPLSALEDMALKSPETRFLVGTKIVSGTRLHFLKDYINNRFAGEEDTAFYIPYENTTLEVRFYLNPSDGYSQGLYLQKGNAYNNESGVLVSGDPKYERVISDGSSTYYSNMTIWQSPIIWEANARDWEKYSIELSDEGWYTLSIWSPISFSRASLEKSGSTIVMDDMSLPRPEIIESWAEFRVTKNGEPLLFLVKRR